MCALFMPVIERERSSIGVAVIAFILLTGCASHDERVVNRDWVFFNLGNTLIDLSQGRGNQSYMPGAKQHLEQLRAKGYHLGLISNIPPDWGTTHQERLARLKNEVRRGWKDSIPFSWDEFELILLPANKEEAKPSPVLFRRALEAAMEMGGRAFFQGESQADVEVAAKTGLESFQIILTDQGTTYRRF